MNNSISFILYNNLVDINIFKCIRFIKEINYYFIKVKLKLYLNNLI